ncbi:MAG: DM13 domain-containing protein [Ilumatobacter sp.]|uniref:DM13 domain-containing protein n=1 Tax=Ilumatobacter sp. TaxID=1967498 RepID=UPI00329842B2
MKFIRNWKVSLPAAGVVLAGLAWLAFGYFGIHTAFVDDEVAEALPEFSAPPAAADDSAVATVPDEADAQVAGTPGSVESADEVASTGSEVAAPGPDEESGDAGAAVETAGSQEAPGSAPPQPTVAPPPSEPQIVTEASGSFAGTSRYDVTGEAIVLGNGTGQRFLRFEEFESSNGPDLNVYLFDPDDPNDFIDLGDLKGNIGEQNYEIAADVDLDRYSRVSIWCVRFSTAFGNADLVAA